MRFISLFPNKVGKRSRTTGSRHPRFPKLCLGSIKAFVTLEAIFEWFLWSLTPKPFSPLKQQKSPPWKNYSGRPLLIVVSCSLVFRTFPLMMVWQLRVWSKTLEVWELSTTSALEWTTRNALDCSGLTELEKQPLLGRFFYSPSLPPSLFLSDKLSLQPFSLHTHAHTCTCHQFLQYSIL